jgi:hypothetical protein
MSQKSFCCNYETGSHGECLWCGGNGTKNMDKINIKAVENAFLADKEELIADGLYNWEREVQFGDMVVMEMEKPRAHRPLEDRPDTYADNRAEVERDNINDWRATESRWGENNY